MKALEIRDIRSEDLLTSMEEKQKQLFNMRSQAMTEKVENFKAVGNLKRDIAKIKTVIRENELKSQ
jgi:large subunit ribosomal protein L29